ncbi:MAG: class E sortase [Gaiellaceae bacterium]
MRRGLRVLGTVLVIAGVGGLAWTATVWFWQDPFTALYTKVQQHRLGHQYDRLAAGYEAPQLERASAETVRRTIAQEARVYRMTTHAGEAIGRILIPRLHLNMILVDGTDEASLKKGPGRDLRTFMPGEGQLVYIAGHRTTYLAPFSHIEQLRRGDRVTLRVPYATFVYRITTHRIVKADDLSVLKSPGHELVELQACHPRFFASHRYIAYARPIRVEPRNGHAYSTTRAATS